MQTTKVVTAALALALVAGSLACKKKEPEPPKPKDEAAASSSAPASATAQPSPNDALTAQLHKLAGSDAKDCGTVSGKGGDPQSASDCAMQSNQASKPFYVRYELPLPGTQMAIATARAGDGKLYTVQYSADGYKEAPSGAMLSGDRKMMTMPCSAQLRVAGSGRVTCFPPQQNAGDINASPHGGGMAMPPGTSPHGSMPPASGANPHGTTPPQKPPMGKSH
jgi:hypothetical protein